MEPYKIIITAEWDPATGLLVVGTLQKPNGEVTHFETLEQIRENQHHVITVGHKIKNAATELIDNLK